MAKARIARAVVTATFIAASVVGLTAKALAAMPSATVASLAWPTPGPVWAISLGDLSCVSAWCLAAGSIETNADPDDTTFAPLVAERSGAKSWSSIPLPPTVTSVSGVSCQALGSCVVVGQTNSGAVALTLTGSAWSSAVLPAPPGWSIDTVGAVACDGTSCTAVGAVSSNYSWTPAVWTLESGSWSVTMLPTTAADTSLSSVSCVDASDCTAIGSDAAGTELVVAVEEAGAWSTHETPAPSSTSVVAPVSISCWAAGSCEAVATAWLSPGSGAMAIAISGTSLTASVLPLESGQVGASLSAIACPGASSCVAVGEVSTRAGSSSIAASLSGTTWSEAPVPGESISLDGITCSAEAQCTAVGSDAADTLSGSTWTEQYPAVGGPPLAGLSAASCATARFCAAVGWYYDELGAVRPVVETWNGTAWKATLPPPPPGTSTGWLVDVSCGAVGRCVAVDGGSWAYVLDGGAWRYVHLPGAGAEAASVSCPTATSCVVVGEEASAGGRVTPLADVLTGTTWRASTPRVPDAVLYAVSCWAARRCEVLDGHAQRDGLVGTVLSLDGTAWRLSGVPLPRGAVSSQLTSVSCASSARCAVVGTYMVDASANGPTTLVVSGPSNGPWRLVRLEGPSGLTSIDCNRSMRCVAVGEPPTYSPHQYFPGSPTLYERTPAGAWVPYAVPIPSGDPDVTLAGTACPPTGACVAVGEVELDVSSGIPGVVTVP